MLYLCQIRNRQMNVNEIPTVIQGSNNVFADLGFSPEEALNLKIRADLMLNISRGDEADVRYSCCRL